MVTMRAKCLSFFWIVKVVDPGMARVYRQIHKRGAHTTSRRPIKVHSRRASPKRGNFVQGKDLLQHFTIKSLHEYLSLLKTLSLPHLSRYWANLANVWLNIRFHHFRLDFTLNKIILDSPGTYIVISAPVAILWLFFLVYAFLTKIYLEFQKNCHKAKNIIFTPKTVIFYYSIVFKTMSII